MLTAAHHKITDLVVIKETLTVLGYALVACTVYYLASRFGFGVTPTAIEFIGTCLNIACVWLARKSNIWTWPLGIAAVVFQGILFWQVNLVGQAGLQAFYFFYQFWGWWLWIDHKNSERTQKPIKAMRPAHWISFGIVYVAGTFILGPIFSTASGAFVYWDGSIVAASLAAQYFLNTKRVGSWLIWAIPVNVAGIGLYAASGIYMVAALYAFFLINALVGYKDWRKEEKLGAFQSANKRLWDST